MVAIWFAKRLSTRSWEQRPRFSMREILLQPRYSSLQQPQFQLLAQRCLQYLKRVQFSSPWIVRLRLLLNQSLHARTIKKAASCSAHLSKLTQASSPSITLMPVLQDSDCEL